MGITITEMNGLVEEISRLRSELKAQRDEAKATEEILASKEQVLIDTLVESNIPSYRAPSGLVSIGKRLSVKTPKEDADRKAFFDYLKAKGIYDNMVGVSSQTLNAFYKAEQEQAELAGNFEFKIPGLNEVSITPTLSFRKN